MRYLIIAASLLILAGCRKCSDVFDTSSDGGKCWRDCGIAAAATSQYYDTRFKQCLYTACRYPSHQECE